MNSLGIELKSDTCIAVLCQKSTSSTSVKLLDQVKISLADSYSDKSVKEFFNELTDFIKKCAPAVIVIKKRNEKGKFAGGAVSFKMEGLIQLASPAETILVSGQQLTGFTAKNPAPITVKKYQEEALNCSLFGLHYLEKK